jgi:hypothetical protein
MVADEPEDFAAKVIGLLNDGKERSRIEQHAAKLGKNGVKSLLLA